MKVLRVLLSATLLLALSLLPMKTLAAEETPPSTQNPSDLVEQAAQLSEDPEILRDRGGEIVDLLNQALTLDNKLVEAYFDLALYYHDTGDDAKTRENLDKVFQLEPEYPNGRALRGVRMLAAGMTAEARAEFDAALAADPYNPIANNQLAEDAIRKGAYSDAIRYARLALLVDSDNMNSYVNIAMAYRKMGQANLAKLVAFNALSMNPKAAQVYNVLGLLYLSEDRVKAAITQFEKALQYRPDYTEANLNLGAIILNYNDFSGARKHFDAVLAKVPDHVDATLSRGVALRGLAKYELAAKDYATVLRLKPGHLGALYNRCILLQEYVTDYEKALTGCDEMLAAIDKKHPQYKEMTDRVQGIKDTMAVLKQMEEDKKNAPPPMPDTSPEGAAAAPAGDAAGIAPATEAPAPKAPEAPPATPKAPAPEAVTPEAKEAAAPAAPASETPEVKAGEKATGAAPEAAKAAKVGAEEKKDAE